MKPIEKKPSVLILILKLLLAFTYIIFLLMPFILFMIPKYLSREIAKYVLLVFILIPIHWKICSSRGILTRILEKLGENYSSITTKNAFSETYLKWFYEPFLKFFKIPWNSTEFDRVITIHIGINIVITWVMCFIYLKRN
jgi:hypothetical protein